MDFSCEPRRRNADIFEMPRGRRPLSRRRRVRLSRQALWTVPFPTARAAAASVLKPSASARTEGSRQAGSCPSTPAARGGIRTRKTLWRGRGAARRARAAREALFHRRRFPARATRGRRTSPAARRPPKGRRDGAASRRPATCAQARRRSSYRSPVCRRTLGRETAAQSGSRRRPSTRD